MSLSSELLALLNGSAKVSVRSKARVKKPANYPSIFQIIKQSSVNELDAKLAEDAELRAQVNCTTSYKGTPLCYLANKLSPFSHKKAEVLIKHGALVDKPDICERFNHPNAISPLFLAFQARNLPFAATLLEHGASISAQYRAVVDSKGKTSSPLNLLEFTVLYVSRSSDPIEELDMILSCAKRLDHAFEVNRRLLFLDKTVLGVVCHYQHVASARLLLEYGADPNIADKDGWTPLHSAALLDNATIALMLMRHGANDALRTSDDDEWFASQKANAATASAITIGRRFRDFDHDKWQQGMQRCHESKTTTALPTVSDDN